MVERRRRREAGEVGDVVEDQPPVVEVTDGAELGHAKVAGLMRADHGHPSHHHDQHQEEGGQQAPGAGQPEGLQFDPALVDLVEQDVGDQVAAEGEEDADAEQAPFRPVEFEVVEDDAEHRDRAQAVEARHVALAAPYWFRHGRPRRTGTATSPRPAASRGSGPRGAPACAPAAVQGRIRAPAPAAPRRRCRGSA